MTQAEAKELIHILLLCAQKAKSNAIEAVCGQGQEPLGLELNILMDVSPWLFGAKSVDLVEMLMTYDSKATLDPVDVFNALHLCGLEPTIAVQYIFWERGELPGALGAMKSMMEADNVHS